MIKRKIKSIIQRLGYDVIKKNENNNLNSFDWQKILINKYGRSDITILDVGAHRGGTAVRYRSIFPNAKIYCFEPFPDSVSELLVKFSEDEKIYIEPRAISDKLDRRTFFLNDKDATNSLLPRPKIARRYFPQKAGPKDTIKVEVVSLDTFVLEKNISTIDILKMDIQGGELMALQGAHSLLQTGRVTLIYRTR